MLLPSIEDKAILRPGSQKHYIPNLEYSEFWSAFYDFLRKNYVFAKPISDMENRINPYFGYFGYCFQALNKIPKYFNLGIDITARAKTGVSCIFDGFLEYAGYAHINGNYVFISHPQIKTEDGFVMHSLYMHLRSFKVKFNSYQKMLRKISFNKYPSVEVKKGFKIGEVGSTGNAHNIHTHLHFQIEFRNEHGKIIVIDPSLILGIESLDNLTKDILNYEDFKSLAKDKQKELKNLGIDKYWKI